MYACEWVFVSFSLSLVIAAPLFLGTHSICLKQFTFLQVLSELASPRIFPQISNHLRSTKSASCPKARDGHWYLCTTLVFHDSSYYISTTSRAAVLGEVVQNMCRRNLYFYLFVLRSWDSYKEYTICVLYGNLSPPVPFEAAAQKLANFTSYSKRTQ